MSTYTSFSLLLAIGYDANSLLETGLGRVRSEQRSLLLLVPLVEGEGK